MPKGTIHQCQCAVCLSSDDRSLQEAHRLTNLFLSRLDEDHRRWYVALESIKLGHGGDRQLAPNDFSAPIA